MWYCFFSVLLIAQRNSVLKVHAYCHRWKGFILLCNCMCVRLLLRAQLLSHVQLCDPVDCSPPGSSVHGIIPARILQWVAVSSSRGSCHQGSNPCLLCVLHWQVVSLLLSHSSSLLTESVTQTHTHTCTCTFFIHWFVICQWSVRLFPNLGFYK